jgi:hypothetical protein
MFLDLAPVNPSVDSVLNARHGTPIVEPEQEAGVERGVMLTDALAIDRFEEIVTRDREVKAATQQVVVGGQGHIDLDAVDLITREWRSASGAAADADSRTLRTAMDRVEQYLSVDASLDLETTLRGRWLAAGQPAETFPGREAWSLDQGTPREIARLVLSLLDSGESIPANQWQSIARAISASELGHELYRIGKYRQGPAVNGLIAAGLDSWTAQYAYVPQLEADSMEQFEWSIGNYSIGLNLISRKAYFTDIGEKWSRVPRSKVLPHARERLQSLRTSDVRGAGLVTSEENIRETLRVSAKASLADRLEYLITNDDDYAFRAARLESLEVRVAGTNATAFIDFHRNVVRASAPIPLRTFGLLCARFVVGLTEEEVVELDSRLSTPSSH